MPIYGGGGGGSWGGTNPYAYQYTPTTKKTTDYWTEYQKSMEKQYGTRAPSSVTYAPTTVKAPTTSAPKVSAPAVSALKVSAPSGGGGGFSYNYPTIATPSVPDYMALAKLWLEKYPELLLPDVERAEYLARSGEEIRPMFEAQESKLRRQAGEEEVGRLQELYGQGLIGGISKEALVDVNKRLTEVLGEMAYQEESMVATRASEMEQTEISNAMTQHAARIQDWGNQYGVSEAAMRNTFLDQMSKAGFEMQLADSAWQRAFSGAQFGQQQQQIDWEQQFAEKEFAWQKGQAAEQPRIDYTPDYVPGKDVPTRDIYNVQYQPSKSTLNYWKQYEESMKKRYGTATPTSYTY